MTLSPNHRWQTPAVRHLAWMCGAPSLIQTGPVFHPGDWLPDDTDARLRCLDRNPEPLLDALTQSQSPRLGHYFEALYHFMMTWLLEWPVVAHNLPIRAGNGATLGELDFIVRNRTTGLLEHHEIAVKFYLELNHNDEMRWFGPNARDQLARKTKRMLSHQLTMTQRPETLQALSLLGLDEPTTPALFMPGTLFVPLRPKHSGPPLPDWVNPEHETGHWIYHSQLDQVDTRHWVSLKPHWLGTACQHFPPARPEQEQALADVALCQRPTLFAELAADGDSAGFIETQRWFVVPDQWPGQAQDV